MINMYFVERHENKLYAAKKSDTRFKRADVKLSHVSGSENKQTCCCLLKGLGTVKHTLVKMLMKS